MSQAAKGALEEKQKPGENEEKRVSRLHTQPRIRQVMLRFEDVAKLRCPTMIMDITLGAYHLRSVDLFPKNHKFFEKEESGRL